MTRLMFAALLVVAFALPARAARDIVVWQPKDFIADDMPRTGGSVTISSDSEQKVYLKDGHIYIDVKVPEFHRLFSMPLPDYLMERQRWEMTAKIYDISNDAMASLVVIDMQSQAIFFTVDAKGGCELMQLPLENGNEPVTLAKDEIDLPKFPFSLRLTYDNKTGRAVGRVNGKLAIAANAIPVQKIQTPQSISIIGIEAGTKDAPGSIAFGRVDLEVY